MADDHGIPISMIDQDRFHEIDHIVMGHAFDVHNTVGRFCDERVYQNEVARRCRDGGLNVQLEAPLRVRHADFVKLYYIDMLIEHGAIYELKTVDAFSNGHHMQLINYLLLAGAHHGKLVNFRPPAVQSRFVSTRMTINDRLAYTIRDDCFECAGLIGRQLRDTLCELLADWGTCLDIALYREAVLHFMRACGAEVREIDVVIGAEVAGAQSMCVLDDATAIHLSAVRQFASTYAEHLVRLLRHTRLSRLHWINIGRRVVEMRTLCV